MKTSVKKVLLCWVVLSTLVLGVEALAYQSPSTEHTAELSKTAKATEEQEVLLEEELLIYALIVSVYAGFWPKQQS